MGPGFDWGLYHVGFREGRRRRGGVGGDGGGGRGGRVWDLEEEEEVVLGGKNASGTQHRGQKWNVTFAFQIHKCCACVCPSRIYMAYSQSRTTQTFILCVFFFIENFYSLLFFLYNFYSMFGAYKKNIAEYEIKLKYLYIYILI